MNRNRLEAFSDGVIAVLITIMVFNLHPPQDAGWPALLPVLPEFLTYILSFIYIGIYWNNHHHMLHAVTRINGKILWANLHLLFWLSLIPFTTGWMGNNHFSSIPTAVYGAVLFLAAIAYTILQTLLVAEQGVDSKLARALGKDLKGKISAALYGSAILMAFYYPWVSVVIYIIVAMMWLVPDRRIEKSLAD